MYKDMMQSTATVDTVDMGQAIEDMKAVAKARRRIFERRWYDNSFFDDGFHFRYYTRSSNKVVDLSERSTIYTPQRSIPKASVQIRGLTNLLLSQDPTPTVYPEPVDKSKYPAPTPNQASAAAQPLPPQVVAPQPGQPIQVPVNQPQVAPLIESPEYLQAVEQAKKVAQYRSKWLQHEWEKDDGSGESILDKVGHMVLLTMKYGVAFMQVWPDVDEEKIRTQVYDAFDIYIQGNMNNIYEAPFIVKAIPMQVAQVKANPLFDKTQTESITPDNRKASSEIKEAYLQSRFGRDTTSDQSATVIVNEAFIKEYVNDANRPRISAQKNGAQLLKDHPDGSPIIRHTFEVAGIWLYDEYTNLFEYPFVEYRLEAGPLYQVPQIERFMPSNKSLDSVVSRVERYTHTMVTGAWLKRRGEQFKLNNIAGGQVVEYDTVPPTQAQISPIPPFVFEFIGLLESFIEEQGVTTTSLGKLPQGVQANAAIESLKESEYAKLVIPTRRLNNMLKLLAKKCLEIADDHFISPQPILWKDKGDILNFQVIGERAAKERKKLKVETPADVITLSKDSYVDIEIEEGMAYTQEGKKAKMQQVINTMIQLLQAQAIPVQAIQVVAQKYLESYQFGATQDFMEQIDEAYKNGGPDLTTNQIMLIKIAVLEALQDAGEIGQQGQQLKTQASALGALQALKDSGVAGQQQPVVPAKESVSIAYKDAPADIQRQMEIKAGFMPSNMPSPGATTQALQHAKILTELQRNEQAALAQQEKTRGGVR